MKPTTQSAAEIIREYGPFPGVDRVNGVTFDGKYVWFASGDRLNALNPESGQIERTLRVPAHAGTAFDGRHLYQIAGEVIQKIDAESGRVLGTLPMPVSSSTASGLAWAEGSLWLGDYSGRKIHQLDPASGAILRTLESNRFVTGITWAGGELWHATWENDDSELRRIDPQTGAVEESLVMPQGRGVSGLESGGDERFFCGGGKSGKVRVVRRPKRASRGA
jgi:streptogramin lyase